MKIFSIILAYIAAATVINANEIREVEVTSFGPTRQEAVYNGLLEATARVNGLDIASEVKSSFSYEEDSSSWFGRSLESSSASTGLKKDVTSATKGYIKHYSVIDMSMEGGEWRAQLLVSVPAYQTPGIDANSRRKIAVMPFSVVAENHKHGSATYENRQLVEQISQSLVNQITQTRKFTVLDRNYEEEIIGERNLILSDDARIDERIKLGQSLGVDYLLVGSLNHHEQINSAQKSSLTGEQIGRDGIEFIIDYRVIVMATRQIKWAETIKILVPMESNNSSLNMALQTAVESATAKITNNLLAAIYPTRILKITETDEIILNQGGSSLSAGLKMDVMKLGEAVIDPYTNESLGASEAKIAELEVTRVTPKMSYAKVISGSIYNLEVYQICRRQPETITSAENGSWRVSDVQIEKNGGVVLPFD
jgi:curli biogenesis system outer membrane secretion channel CsgG